MKRIKIFAMLLTAHMLAGIRAKVYNRNQDPDFRRKQILLKGTIQGDTTYD